MSIPKTPLSCPSDLDVCELRKALIGSGFVQDELAETLAVRLPTEHMEVPVVLRRVSRDRPYDVLVRLFLLGQAVTASHLQRALGGMDLAPLLKSGLVQEADGGVRAVARLAPFHDMYLVSDFGPEITGGLPEDHVLGVGFASLTLAGLSVAGDAKCTLDLGTGAGVQAFVAARSSERVIATDINGRALNFAVFNAFLNGVTNIEWRFGSLYEPVEGMSFDRIVTNPPFVISPDKRFVFRDGTVEGDGLSQSVIEGIGQRLEPGGFATVLFNWYHGQEDDWAERPRQWLSDCGCDVWLLRFKSADPLTYAADWLRADCPPGEDYSLRLDEWLEYYRELGAEFISAGAVVLRRCPEGQSPWFRADSLPDGGHIGGCGAQIRRIFDNEAMLSSLPTAEALMDKRLILVADPELQHNMHVTEGRWTVTSQILRQTNGFTFRAETDVYMANLLAKCDGSVTVGELVAEIAQQLQMELAEVATPCLAMIRQFLRNGLLASEVPPVEVLQK